MSESAVQKVADTQGLTTGILLTSTGLFTNRVHREIGDVGPLTRIGGLSLFQRAALTFQRAGISQLFVLVGEEEEALKRCLRHGPRVTIPVRWMPIREFPLDDPRTWEALATDIKGFCAVVGAQAVFSRGLIDRLRQEVQDDREGQAIVVVRQMEVWERLVGGSNPAARYRGDRLIALSENVGKHAGPQGRGEIDEPVAADLLVLPAALLSSSSEPARSEIGSGRLYDGERGVRAIRRVLNQAITEGRVRAVPTLPASPQWYRDVKDPAGAQRVERTLFQSLKGEFEGFVDRYFNRTVSRFFTKLFLHIGLSPNTITVLATMLGLCAALSFAMGTYAAGIVGALLFQLAAIIDCCDGEVARLTFTESPFGAWLDIAADNVVHMAIFAGIAGGVYAAQGMTSSLPLMLGALAVVGNALSFWLVTKAQTIRTTRGWENPAQAAWSNFMLHHLASRDFSVVVLIFALLGKLDWFLWMAAVGSTVFWLMMLWIIRPSLNSRA
ncbi:MAG: CDP-alcohol phosphatidyltransferase family protein [Nitrospiraceae bacterium]